MNEVDRNLLYATAKCLLALYGALAPRSPVAEELEENVKAWEEYARREAATRNQLLAERETMRRKWGEE